MDYPTRVHDFLPGSSIEDKKIPIYEHAFKRKKKHTHIVRTTNDKNNSKKCLIYVQARNIAINWSCLSRRVDCTITKYEGKKYTNINNCLPFRNAPFFYTFPRRCLINVGRVGRGQSKVINRTKRPDTIERERKYTFTLRPFVTEGYLTCDNRVASKYWTLFDMFPLR